MTVLKCAPLDFEPDMNKELLSLNALSPGPNLEAYLQTVNSIAVLTSEQEQELAKRLYDEGDVDAARQLVIAHLRLLYMWQDHMPAMAFRKRI